jgi:hypothetical protein
VATRTRSARLACALIGIVTVAAGCVPMAPEGPKEESSKPAIVPLPDEASMQQVIDPAKEFVILNQLQDVSGTFGWVACGGQDEALYHGEVRLSFLLPKDVDEGRYIKQIVKMMVSHGWMDNPAQGDRSFETILHTNEVRAAISGGDSVNKERGTVRLSGECRNTNDHRDDSAGINITGQLAQR